VPTIYLAELKNVSLVLLGFIKTITDLLLHLSAFQRWGFRPSPLHQSISSRAKLPLVGSAEASGKGLCQRMENNRVA
jgi:hypothetical protein